MSSNITALIHLRSAAMSSQTSSAEFFGRWWIPKIYRPITMRQQLLWSHLRVTGLAAVVFAFAAIAIQSLTTPMATMQQVNMPSAHAAMTIQLGLHRSIAALNGWVALKDPQLLKNQSLAWTQDIQPAFEQLVELNQQAGTAEREQALNELDKKLKRLQKLQAWVAAVAAKPGNEPARLVFSQELAPVQIRITDHLHRLAVSKRAWKKSTHAINTDILKFQLVISQASAALGRFVVEGLDHDANIYHSNVNLGIDYLHTLQQSLSSTVFGEEPLRELQRDLDIFQRLAESIIASRRSPRSNVAWSTIENMERPLATQIALLLDVLSANEVRMMRERVEQISSWTQALAIGSVLALMFMIIVAIILSHTEARRISAPISRLCRALEMVGKGKHVESVIDEGVSEVRHLIQGFNEMRISISESHSDLEKMAYTDELTGLSNRKGFNTHFNYVTNRAQRNRQYTGIILIDLDRFKQVNDTLGHDAGDFLLKSFSERLQECLRPGDQAARFGGDEFAVVLESLSQMSDAEIIVHRIQECVSQPLFYAGQKIIPSATIGIAVSSLEDLDSKRLLINADQALYEAKEFQRGSYRFFSKDMQSKAQRSRRMLELIEDNDPQTVFSVVYQPYVDMKSQRITGVEALLRWIHPDCSPASPPEFIELLERTGHIGRISQWVLLQATSQLNVWNTRHGGEQLSVSVNVSANLLGGQQLVNMVTSALKESNINPHQLILEVTESMLIQDFDRSLSTMSQLNTLGVRFAMDDFGTGYSSLSRLKEMPLDLLKIDRSFVGEMLTSKNATAIVAASVQLGHAIGLQVTAEGIEDPRQAEILRELGCNIGQGYYFGYPSSVAQIDEHLKASGHLQLEFDSCINH